MQENFHIQIFQTHWNENKLIKAGIFDDLKFFIFGFGFAIDGLELMI